MDEQIKRVPPHSAEVERAVLGAMFQQNSALVSVLEHLQESDFYLPANREIFACMHDLHAKGKPADEVTVVEALEKRGALKQAGGVTYITDLQRQLPAITNLPHYVSLILEKATLRKLIIACEEIMDEAYAGEDELDVIVSGAEKRIFDISLKNVSGGLVQIEPALTNSYLKIAERASQTGLTGLPCGFNELDQKLSGLQKSDLIVVAGRPAMGKTSFAINIAQHAATKEDAVVAVFSLEMAREQLATRMLCTQARVDMQRVKSGQVMGEDWTSLAAALSQLAPAKFFVDDTAGITLAEMRSKLRRLKIESGKLDMVVIDYLQLMTYRGKADNRQQEIAETTRQLKIMARDLDVPILLLSQLSRGPEQRPNKRPLMSDLRESGAIEQDADIIILLYRASAYPDSDDEEVDTNIAHAIVAKHRNGSTGDVKLTWRGEYTMFDNFAGFEAPFDE